MGNVHLRTLVLTLAVFCILLAACKKDDDDIIIVPTAAHTDCDSEVFDPKLDGSPTVTITYAVSPAAPTYTVDVKIMDGATLVRLLVDDASQKGGLNHTAEWDGKNDAGQFVDPGTYQVVIDAQHATATPTTCDGEINVVRLGADQMSFGGYSMVYPSTSSGNTADFAITTPQWAIQGLDTTTGTPRAEAVPNQNATYPDSSAASNYNYPFCYAAGSKVQYSAGLGSQAVSNVTQNPVGVNYPVTGHQIRIESEGYSTSDAGADDISPGDAFTFEANTALPGSCAAGIIPVDLTFSYKDGAKWIQIPGKYSTTHELYRTIGAPRAVDYNGGGVESYMYAPLVEWSCTWAAGRTGLKGVADDCYLMLEDCGLKYGILAWYTATMFDNGGGMCGGWYQFFDHLVAVQGFATEMYFYGLSPNAGTAPEQKWASIVILAPGINQTEPVFVNLNDYRCVETVYPEPCYISDFDATDDVDFYQNKRWYKFSSPTSMDGHCINFVVSGGVVYLYDASFRNTAGPTPIAGTFTTLPAHNTYTQGSSLTAFKNLYYNSAIDYHRGDVYADHDNNPGTAPVVRTLDIRTSLFGPDELRLLWLKD